MSTLSVAGVEVRGAGQSDAPAVFGRYLAELLDVEDRAGDDRVLVAEHGARVVGVVRGRLAVRHGGRDVEAGPGTRFQIRPGVAHDFWNASGEEVRVVVEVQPGERLVQLIRQLFLTAQDGRADAKGKPRPLRAAVLAREFADTIRFTSPPRLVQRALSGLLAPVARATGQRALDPAYLRRELPIVDLEPLPAEIAALVPDLATQPARSTP